MAAAIAAYGIVSGRGNQLITSGFSSAPTGLLRKSPEGSKELGRSIQRVD